jgi:NAD+ kinase
MKFILRVKPGYGEKLRDRAARLLESNGAEWTARIEKGCDFALIFGGDGTLMRDHSGLDCPVLGINPGKSKGYYLRAGPGDYDEKILRLLNGREGKDYYLYELMRLEASVNGKKVPALALNDVLVSPVYVRRMLQSRIETHRGKSVESNSGIIVYTPTGSHAFAHSAGAGKMRYDCGMMGVAALAPYSGLLKKKEILTDRGPVRIDVLSETAEVCIDGSEVNIMRLRKGDKVNVEKSGNPLRLVGFGKAFA